MSKDEKKEPKFDDMVEGAIVGDEPTAQSTILTGYKSQPDFDPADVYIPNLRLAQGLTPEVQQGEARPGQWLVLGYEPVVEVQVVPLLYSKTHEHRSKEDRTVTECTDDACALREWTGPKESRKPPECTTVYRYMVYSVTHDALATVRFARTAQKTGRIFNTAVARAGLGNVALVLKSVAQTGPTGQFYAPTCTPVTVAPEVLSTAARRLAMGM